MMKRIALLGLALLPLAAPSAQTTNSFEFREAPIRDVVPALSETYGVNLVVPDHLGGISVSLSLKGATLSDLLRVMDLKFVADGMECHWAETKTRNGQAAYALEAKPGDLHLTLLADARGQGLTTTVARLQFREAPMGAVATYLAEQTGVQLLLPEFVQEVAVSLDVRAVSFTDVLEFLFHLLGDGAEFTCQGLQLSTGQWVFALLPVPQPPPPAVEGLVKVYYAGKTDEELVRAHSNVQSLLSLAGLASQASVMLHTGSGMLVVRGPQNVQDFVLNAMEELRRGREPQPAPAPQPAHP